MRGTTPTIAIGVLAVGVSTVVAAAGTIAHGVARMVADGVRSITINALVAAAGAISHGMARVVADRVVSGRHDICRSIRWDLVHEYKVLSNCLRCWWVWWLLETRSASFEGLFGDSKN